MLKIRHAVLVLGLLFSPAALADAVRADVHVGFSNADIGVHIGSYPRLTAIPGHPVYYAPRLRANLFFYDGMYWVFHDDLWYASSWYDGPWSHVHPIAVPAYILRIPVRYYRYPPPYFRDWKRDAPPRWRQYWGNDWERQRRGWDRWDPRAAPSPAPLPVYQRRYSGDGYPRQIDRQHELHRQHYRYQPRESTVRERYQPAPPADRPHVGDGDRTLPPRYPARMEHRDSRPDRSHIRRSDRDDGRSRDDGRGRND